MTLIEKLVNIQQNLNAPKDQFNSFGKYSYRSAESILQAVKPLLAENKVALMLSDSIEAVGNRIYVRATATLTDTETKETISVDAFAREEESKKGMDASQVTGASSSYARKYALNGLFAIDDNKDSDATNMGDKQPVNGSKAQNVKVQAVDQKTAQAALKQPVEAPDGYFYCADCGSVIKTVLSNDTVIPSRDVAARTIGKYGRQLCAACAKNEGKTS